MAFEGEMNIKKHQGLFFLTVTYFSIVVDTMEPYFALSFFI